MIREIDATLSDFYYMVGLPSQRSPEYRMGPDKMLTLEFSTTITEMGDLVWRLTTTTSYRSDDCVPVEGATRR
jgi:hypothetical protein